jgi:peroxiredoxin Q/BCP
MKRFALSAAAVIALTAAGAAFAAQQAPAARPAPAPPGPDSAGLAVGSMAPDFTATAYENGQKTTFNLKTALKKGPVVLYFFPGAFTPGCNVEAKNFADAIDGYKKVGAQVVGITGGYGTSDKAGPPAANLDDAVKDFSTEKCNGKFPVAVASADTVAAYKAILTQRPGWATRISYVITPDDKVALSFFHSGADQHVEKTLAAVTDWKGAHKG